MGPAVSTLKSMFCNAGQGDDFNHIMVEALADRLAEAFAEKLHQIVRKDLWGYAPDEDFSTEDLLKVKYQGQFTNAKAHFDFDTKQSVQYCFGTRPFTI